MRQHKREPLQGVELTQLEAACRTGRERLIVFTLADTGLRVAELAALRRDNVDFQLHRIMFLGKGGKRRVIKLSPRARAVVESHFAINDTVGMSKRTIQRIVMNLARAAKITRPTSPHVLRHTFATNCVRKGISLPALQKLLGHETMRSTEIYLNLSPESAIEEFDAKW